MVRLNRIYTKTGDDGTTALVDGTRVPKNDRRVCAYGNLDELSAHLGMAISELHDRARAYEGLRDGQDRTIYAQTYGGDPRVRATALKTVLRAIQQDLFDMGSLLATPVDADIALPAITDAHVQVLEETLDRFNEDLAPLKSFVLPGGHPVAARLHVARTVCRSAERDIIGVAGTDQPGRRILHYLNRLSDLLFVLSRWINHDAELVEPLWQPESGTLKLPKGPQKP
jgi:cob(I)alamin adenosyltransferase